MITTLLSKLLDPHYDGQWIRTLMHDGNPRFVLKDIADALGERNISVLARLLDDDELCDGRLLVDGKLLYPLMVVSEPGFYRLLINYNSPKTEPCCEIIQNAMNEYFTYVESEKKLPRGIITKTALSGDFETASSMAKAPKRETPPMEEPDVSDTEPLGTDSILETLHAIGFDAVPDDLNDVSFLSHAVYVMRTYLEGLNVGPQSLLGKLADALGIRFQIEDGELVEVPANSGN